MTEEELLRIAAGDIPDLRPAAIRELEEVTKAMSVMLTLRHRDEDDMTRFWYTQSAPHLDPALLYIMTNVPPKHRIAASLDSLDHTIINTVSPYCFDLIMEYRDAFNAIPGVNLSTDMLVGGKGEEDD